MLAGMQDEFAGTPLAPADLDISVGESMFETMGNAPRSQFGPSAQEMAERMRVLQTYRKVTLKEVVVRTYDLGKENERFQYQLDMEHLVLGVQLRTHALLARPAPQFINDAGGPRYIAHLEWMEFVLNETPAPVTGVPREGARDEQAVAGSDAGEPRHHEPAGAVLRGRPGDRSGERVADRATARIIPGVPPA